MNELLTAATSIPLGRRRLATVLRRSGDLVRVGDVSSALEVSRSAATKLLSRWAKQGWLRRVGPGTYAAASLDAVDRDRVLDDPWVLVPPLYSPCYVGGWTAAEHWDLTEQLFRPIVVMTTRPVHKKEQNHHGTPFLLRHTHPRKLFGTRSVWRSRSRVMVSDIHRTIVDMLDDSAVGGGSQHVADCVAAYFRHADRDDGVLVDYAELLGNGAVFKRLGFIAEQHAEQHIVDACADRLTGGYAMFDPALPCTVPIARWRLRIPPGWHGYPDD
ncbi:MAG: type IV toxin-antitoxin system AbiEi family antitoxin domain-containing protein [Gammaproteobacteria bacterium]|nr:type IV toxin-antitoxin system AbiEi family antitoxin domain-containing protein [Gammaproteobacteria bacterium]